MLGFSIEHLVILGIVLIIFGPKRLPQLGHTMGQAMKNFKDALSGVQEADFTKLENSSDESKKEASQNKSDDQGKA